ncbi:aromatic aminotransferase ISS1 isoform X3 [Prunus dulcis]|uniref:aromatic aminotransferase ISS1 isoform X3 n=1 Tax=Prunus dulcis TaxID=3755 RepID=UPI001481EFF8|nr:aromatic aminotransferase ISS1 isoform X3 [Prunus dulcis]
MGSYGKLAKRAVETEMPIMVQIQQLVRGAKNAVSLAQGVVHWQPPKQALDKVKELVWEPSISRYGADEGILELREALVKKLHNENKLYKSSVMVTSGANQAFVNLVLTLCDSGDSVVMFAPYYFNAYMSFQMTGVTNILVGPGHPETLYPDADWLEKTLSETKPTPKLVTVVNPGNPSGTYIPDPLLKIAYPSEVEGFATQLLKVQDNIPICASIISQYLALHSLEMGPEWVTERVKGLVKNKEIVLEALSPLGKDAVKGGEGAIYLWAKLPDKYADDDKFVHWLAHRHGVVVIPGSACGCPGNVRISFGGLLEDDCKAAAERLRRGLEELIRDGMVQ